MVTFRVDRGGMVMVGAVLLIGIGAMPGHFAAGLLLGALTAASLLLHECGHMLAAWVSGAKVHEIGICLKGSYLRRQSASAPIDDFAISLSGPMVNALIAAVLWPAVGAAHWLAIYNLVLAVSNLVPLPGSDGKRALQAWRQATSGVRVSIEAGKPRGK